MKMRFCLCVLTLTLFQLSSDNFRFKKKVSDYIIGYLTTFECYRLFLLLYTALQGNMKTVLHDCSLTKIQPMSIWRSIWISDVFSKNLPQYMSNSVFAFCFIFCVFLFCYMAPWFYVHSRNSVHKHETVLQLLLLLFLVLIFQKPLAYRRLLECGVKFAPSEIKILWDVSLDGRSAFQYLNWNYNGVQFVWGPNFVHFHFTLSVLLWRCTEF